MLREIKADQRLMRHIVFSVDGTGTAAIDEGKFAAALTDNGTGDYTLTFTKAFARKPVVAVGIQTANCYHQISSISVTAIRIKLFKVSDQSAQDGLFQVFVQGSDSASQDGVSS